MYYFQPPLQQSNMMQVMQPTVFSHLPAGMIGNQEACPYYVLVVPQEPMMYQQQQCPPVLAAPSNPAALPSSAPPQYPNHKKLTSSKRASQEKNTQVSRHSTVGKVLITPIDDDANEDPAVGDVLNHATDDRFSDPASNAMIADLRKEKTDRNVRARVLRLPIEFCHAMVAHLSSHPQLMDDLCMHERGIIVAHIVERLGAAESLPIIDFALQSFLTLAHNQSGCIALPRILAPIVDVPLLDKFFDLTMTHMPQLIDHPFGNYVVKHFVGLKNARYNVRIAHDFLQHNFLSAATNKFGSHIAEELIKALELEELMVLVRTVFSDLAVLKALTMDRFANYCVQTIFRSIANGDAHFYSWCVAQVIGVVRGSPYEQNIMKNAISGYHAAPQK